MIVSGAPLYLTVSALAILVAIGLFRASGNWRGKTREELDREVEKYTK